jgi:hypothetical protein
MLDYPKIPAGGIASCEVVKEEPGGQEEAPAVFGGVKCQTLIMWSW